MDAAAPRRDVRRAARSGPRLRLPADESRRRRPRTASARRTSCSCTADRRACRRRSIRQDRLLHEPRDRRPRRQLRRIDAATGAPTASACAGSGASSTSRTSSPPRAGLAESGAPMPRASPSREAPPADGRCSCALDAHRTRSPPGISRYGVADLRARSPRTRTTSRRATSTAWSVRCRRPRSSTSSGRRCRTSSGSRTPLLIDAGRWTTWSCRRPSPRPSATRSPPTASRTPTSRSRARATGSVAPRPWCDALEAEVAFLGAGVRLRDAGRAARSSSS